MQIFDKFHLDDIHTLIFDFDGIFTDNKVFFDKNGNELVMCDRADGFAFNLLRKFLISENLNIDFFILSSEQNPVLISRAKKLNLPCFYGVKDKLEFIKNHFSDRFKSEEDISKGIVYFGNDLNDYEAMKFCRYSIAPENSHVLIKNISTYVLESEGGNGFLREFVEKLIYSKNLDLLSFV